MEKLLISNSNLNPFNIIMGAIISFQSSEDRDPINIKLPTVQDTLDNPDFQTFMSILYAEPENFADLKLGFAAKNKGELLLGLTLYNKMYSDLLWKYFSKYIIRAELKDNGIFVDEQKILSHELEYIAVAILISMGYKKLEDLELKSKEEQEAEDNMSEAEKRLLERQKSVEEKLRKAKQRKHQSSTESLTQEKIFLAVMYEFNFSLEDVKKMNFYAISWYFGYAYQLDYHKVLQYAAGAGNLGKKNKYEYWLK